MKKIILLLFMMIFLIYSDKPKQQLFSQYMAEVTQQWFFQWQQQDKQEIYADVQQRIAQQLSVLTVNQESYLAFLVKTTKKRLQFQQLYCQQNNFHIYFVPTEVASICHVLAQYKTTLVSADSIPSKHSSIN